MKNKNTNKFLVLCLVVALSSPLSAQEPEKSIRVNLLSRLQTSLTLKDYTFSDGAKKRYYDYEYGTPYTGLHLSANYGIFSLYVSLGSSFRVRPYESYGGLFLSQATAALNFSQAFKIDMGYLRPPRYYEHDIYVGQNLGTQYFSNGTHERDFGVKFHGLVANKFLEYSLFAFHGVQRRPEDTQHNMNGPGAGFRFRINPLKEVASQDYFLGKRSAVSLGMSFDYQLLPPSAYYYKLGASQPDQKHLFFFNAFVNGDVILGKITLPFMLVYEHWEFFRPRTITPPKEIVVGSLTGGMGVYIIAAKIMPAIRTRFVFYKLDMNIYDKNHIENDTEFSLAYFPYGHNLNIKLGYALYFYRRNVKVLSGAATFVEHKLAAQLEMYL